MLGRPIPGRFVGLVLITLSYALGAQETAPPASTRPALSDLVEFPVVMQQKIAAGITPVGTKVQAKLTIATLVKGRVISKGAVFSGEITESEAKSATSASRLGIRMDSVHWKDGDQPVKIYLTAWYYPPRGMLEEDGSRPNSGMHGEIGVSVGMGGSRTPYPPGGPITGRGGPDEEDAGSFPSNPVPTEQPASITSNHRVLMKNVESSHGSDGAVVLSNKHSNLKLDKLTTYVLAAEDLLPEKR